MPRRSSHSLATRLRADLEKRLSQQSKMLNVFKMELEVGFTVFTCTGLQPDASSDHRQHETHGLDADHNSQGEAGKP